MTKYIPQHLDTDIPIFKAIADAIERDVFSNRLAPGQQLPPQRELADLLNVNVSTVTRGYKEAQRRGLISSTVGRGTFISLDAAMDYSLVAHEPYAAKTLEMGLVTPLYAQEPDPSGVVLRISKQQKFKRFFQYNDPAGLRAHRETGALWASRYGIKATADAIVITAGAQHALTCCLSCLFQSGDRIAIENLTYPGIKSLAMMLGIKLVPIQMDTQAMLPEALDNACRRDHIKGLYLMPSMQNPTATHMSSNRRDQIAETAERYNLTLIEDDAYALTCPNRPEPVANRIPDNSVYIAGVSKALMAGLRIAFVAAPKSIRSRLSEAIFNTVWMAPPLNAEIISRWIMDGTADNTISNKQKEAALRFSKARKILSDFSFSGYPYGYFIWLNLPGNQDGKAFEARVREAGINIFCGERFAVGSMMAPSAVRISLSGPPTLDELEKGLSIIRDILDGTAREFRPIF